MSEFTQSLARMVAEAKRPVYVQQQYTPVIGKVQSKKPDQSNLGESVGSAVGAYLGKHLAENLPQNLRKRALLAHEYFSNPDNLTEEQRRQIFSYPTVQERLRKYLKVAPEYFYVREDGMVDTTPGLAPETRETVARTRASQERANVSKEVAEKLKKMTPKEVERIQLENRLARETLPDVKKQEAAKANLYTQQVETQKTTQGLQEAQKAYYTAMSEWYKKKKNRELGTASVSKIDEQYQPLLKLRNDIDEQLRKQYQIDSWLNPNQVTSPAYVIEDINATSNLVDQMQQVVIPLEKKDPAGRQLYATVPGALQSPSAQFWVRKSLTEAYNMFLYQDALVNHVGEPDTRALEVMSRILSDATRLFNKTYGAYTEDVAKVLPQPGGYRDAYSQIAQMKLLYNDLLPPQSPNRLPEEQVRVYSEIVKNHPPVAPWDSDLPLNTQSIVDRLRNLLAFGKGEGE